MATSQDFVNWVCDPRRLDWRFLKAALMAEGDHLLRFASGTTHQTIYFPEVKAFHLCLPPIDEQRRIAAVLGALDEKSASTRCLADDLRGIADALFDHALRTEGIQSTVGEWVEFHNKRRRPLSARQRAETPGSVPYYGATGIVDYVSEALFDEPLLLAGEDGSVIRDDGRPVTQYVWGPAWVNNHAHVLTGRGISTELALLALGRASVTAWVTGAVQAKLSMGQLRRVPIVIPGAAVRRSLEATIAPLFAHLRGLADDALTLRALHDALLPKLVSGQIRVPAEDADPVSLVA